MSSRQHLERSFRHKPTGVSACLAALLLALPLQAQQESAREVLPFEEGMEIPEWMRRVRPAETGETRATPLEQAQPYRPPGRMPYEDAPEVSREIPTAPAVPAEATAVEVPTARAVPVETPIERVEPAQPIQPADPPPSATPQPEASARETSPEETENRGVIRVAPGANREVDPNKVRLATADGFFAREMYTLAAEQYEEFLRDSGGKEGRAAAHYRLGESYRAMGDMSKARAAYERLLDETREGEFAGAAAYRLGEIYMDADIWLAAATQFELAARESTSAAVRLSATFFAARCLGRSGEFSRALELYDQVLANDSPDNPYRVFALSGAAQLARSAGRSKDAIRYYEQLAALAGTPEQKAEALVSASQLLMEEEETAKARELLEQVSTLNQTGSWRGIAALGLLEIDYRDRQFEKLTAIPESHLQELPPESLARGLLLKANAYRQLGKYEQALSLYDRIMIEHPKSEASGEADFQRLVSLYHREDPRFEEEVNAFLLRASNDTERDQAQLLQAESHYKKGNYEEAAAAYAAVRFGSLNDRLRADALYKRAWCLLQVGQGPEAAVAFSEFLEAFPESDLRAAALVQRAEAHQAAGAADAAKNDYSKVIQEAPGTPEAGTALLQKGLLLGKENNNAGMRKAFQQFLADYPEADTAARAQAEFWTGWSLFEEQSYSEALPHLEKARELNPEAYDERASLRIILANYYREDRDATAGALRAKNPGNVPGEVYVWLAERFLDDGKYAEAESFLRPLADGTIQGRDLPRVQLQLARAQLQQGKFADSLASSRAYLETTRDPAERATARLLMGEAYLGQRSFAEAKTNTEEALALQPEGRMNGQARILLGRIEAALGNHEEAGKTFATVAILYDDPELTPQALVMAAESFQKAGKPVEAAEAREELARRFPEQASTGNTGR